MYRSVLVALLMTLTQPPTGGAGAQSPRAGADTTAVFPAVEGRNLEGRVFTLPADFGGALNVVLIAFTRGQQHDVDSWMPFLRTMTAARSDLSVYELPTLGRRYRLMRSIIDGGMRGGIPDRAVREATITLYIDKAPFRKSLRLENEDRIHVLVVTRDGVVRWRGAGPFDPAAGESLRQFLANKGD